LVSIEAGDTTAFLTTAQKLRGAALSCLFCAECCFWTTAFALKPSNNGYLDHCACTAKMSTKSTARICSVAALALLIFAALGPGTWVPRSGLGWQFDHVIGYLAFTWLFCLAWPRPLVVGPAFMGLAVLLEGLQTFTPDRHADLHAALLNAGAVLTAASVAELFIRVSSMWTVRTFLTTQFGLLRPALNNARTALLTLPGHARLFGRALARAMASQFPASVGLLAQPIPVSLRTGLWLGKQRASDRDGIIS
jgi:hypothetical protein